jgi:uncharacterized protein (TIGR02284 family)
MASKDHDVETLETLTSTLTDSIHGYEEAANVAKPSPLAGYLRSKAQERREVTERFRQRIAALRGDAKVGGSVTAAAHRQFMQLKTLFQDDTKAAVEEVERGESHLKDKFEECMKDAELSPDIKQLITTTYDRVRFDHAQWDRLKSAQSN